MGIIRIFLASSVDLKDERREFEIFINRKSSFWKSRGIALKLIFCEDFLDAVSKTYSQDEYNKAIRECDIFVMLFFTKVGKCSEEEFDVAFKQFKEIGKPKIFTYCKYANANTKDIEENDILSLFSFKKKINNLGHYLTEYENISQLKLKFSEQLDKLLELGFIKNELIQPEKYAFPKELTISIPKVHPFDIIGRENDLEEVHRLLNQEKRAVVINGIGGIGKTTLVQVYVSKYYNEYSHILWITQTSENIKTDFINASGLIQNLKVPAFTMDSDKLFEDILIKLKSIGNAPNLLVIDNGETSLIDYCNSLPSQPNWHLIITSREEINGYYNKSLNFLKEDKAIQLFKKYYTLKRIADQEIRDLVAYIDFNTLVIKLLALTAQTHRYELKQLKTALKDDLEANIVIEHNAKQMKILKIGSYLSTVYHLGNLNKIEILLIEKLSFLRSEFHTYEQLKQLIIDPRSSYNFSFSEALTSITQKGWLIHNIKTDSYKMHRVMAEVVYNQINKNDERFKYLFNVLSNKSITNNTLDENGSSIKFTKYHNQILKRIFDIGISIWVVIFILSWLVPIVGIIIWIESKGPIFAAYVRSGKNNKEFLCYKFRCFPIHDDRFNQQEKKEEIITQAGRFLRRTSLEDFPQFINVFRGEMSIVGPKPLQPIHTKEYLSNIGQDIIGTFLKPGVTGWAQVNGLKRERVTLDELKQKVEYDVWYLKRWSLILDFKIIFLTVFNTIVGD